MYNLYADMFRNVPTKNYTVLFSGRKPFHTDLLDSAIREAKTLRMVYKKITVINNDTDERVLVLRNGLEIK